MDKAKVKRILVITLSNIGDAILTTPVIRILRRDFPQAHLAVLVGPRAFSVFKSDYRIDNLIIYDKSISWKNKLVLVNRLRHERYDLVVDLRHSLFGVLLGARYHPSIFAQPPKSLLHMKDRHLWRLKPLGLNIDNLQGPHVVFSEAERDNVKQMFDKWQIKDGQMLVAVAAGARNLTKRWQPEGYGQLIEQLSTEYHAKIIMVGDKKDEVLIKEIIAQVKPELFNACGKTNIGELSFLLTKCKLLITNDSAPMHLGWAVGIPVVSIFGPTDYKKYAPGGPYDLVIRKELPCAPCEKSLCFKGTRACLKLISADEVFAACKKILDSETRD